MARKGIILRGMINITYLRLRLKIYQIKILSIHLQSENAIIIHISLPIVYTGATGTFLEITPIILLIFRRIVQELHILPQ